MVRKIAGGLALVMFAVCVGAGLSAGNTFSTILTNALLGMGAAFGVGLVVGAMAQKMLDESLAAEAKKPSPDGAAAGADRKTAAVAGGRAPAEKV